MTAGAGKNLGDFARRKWVCGMAGVRYAGVDNLCAASILGLERRGECALFQETAGMHFGVPTGAVILGDCFDPGFKIAEVIE